MRILVLIILLYIPVNMHAAVIINEIAWMGTDISANDEWIELRNTGNSDVSLEGWVLRDGVNLEIDFSGLESITAGSYAVLERTDDVSAPGDAFLIYTGALTNTGATLTLYRKDGSIEDQVAGGEDWKNVGGDNVTKETAQYTSSGWITAEATPGRVNKTENAEGEGVTGEEGENGGEENKSSSSKLGTSDAALSLSIDAPGTVYVNQPVTFSVNPSGLGKTLMQSLVYMWNFGDLSTTSQKEPQHVFAYPGEYVVTVHGNYAHYQQVARKQVTVLPVAFSMTRNLRGDIQIHNNAKYEIDTSGYVIVGTKKATFPDNSIILANGTVTVPKEKIGAGDTSYIQLLDQKGTLVAVVNTSVATESLQEKPDALNTYTASVVNAQEQKDGLSNGFIFSTEEVEPEESDAAFVGYTFDSQKISPQGASVNESSQVVPEKSLPLLGLIGVILFGIFGVYFGRSKNT